jgi:hypothetical protein
MRRGEKELTDETSLLPAVVQTTERGLRFEQLLFPKLHMTSEPGGVALRQHYYGYYRRAIQDALRRSSRKPLQCGGLQGYEQLVAIGQHLQQRRIQFGSDSYLDPLQARVQTAVHKVAAQAQGVRQARTFLTRVEHYLAHVPRPSAETGDPVQTSSVPGSQVVRQELTRMFSDLAQQPVVHPVVRRLLSKWRSMSKTWLPGILYCYDIPGLPRSNLDLESVFGRLRRAQRRVTGRKETTPLRIFGPGQMMLLTLGDEEVLPQLQSVPVDVYWSQRRRQAEREEPRRWLRRLHRDPAQALKQLDEQFYAVVKAQAGASLNTPDHQ